ncbi:MAG: glycosyltransferase family 4 protein [SAR202 cluster bacterium]|nr:glycosyltransferase family 4 protein [SAR202 cluster bacterium]
MEGSGKPQRPMSTQLRYRVTIIAPTCFYYQAPLFRELASDERIDLTVYFCSNEGVSGEDVKIAYGSDKNWGVQDELLEGYRHKFLHNHAPRGSYLKSLVGLANFGVWNELKRERPDAVIIMSWMNPTWWLTFLACLRFKIPLLFMTDANVDAEQLKSPWKAWIKRIVLDKMIFRGTAGFLCAGTANQSLYTYYGVPKEKLVHFAYSWGYEAMMQSSEELVAKKKELRRKHGLPEDAVIVLYCGRFSPEKGSMELVNAYNRIDHPKKALVLVGDGGLRSRMQDFSKEQDLDSIYFMGFQTRDRMGEFYALADIFVLPSQKETWGMVVNEALCFRLPVIVSDQVGAGVDLVIPEENGQIFPTGDVQALSEQMTRLISLPEDARRKMGDRSYKLITSWTDRNLALPLREFLDSLYARKG